MSESDRLALLKLDLQIMMTASDPYLLHLLAAAEEMIRREGIVLPESVEDEQLRIMYAAYLYRKRAGEDPGMPRMLRWALNNRLLAQKAEASDAL